MLKRVTKKLIFALIAGSPLVLASVQHSHNANFQGREPELYLHEIKTNPIRYADLEKKIGDDYQALSATQKGFRNAEMPISVSGPLDRIVNHTKTPYFRRGK